jgi:iron complex outermembrane recepter protein
LGDWQHDGNRWSQFLPSQGTLYNDNPNGIIPVDTFLGEPGLEFALRDQGSIGYTGDHLFSDGWNLHSNYRFEYINFNGRTFYGTGFDTTIPNNTTLVSRSAYAYTNGDHLNTVDTRALRHFKTGNWEQTVLFGYDYQHIGIRETDGFAAAPDINIFHPVYGQTTFPDLFYYLNNNSVLQQQGLYAQDQIKYRDHLVFTLGSRQDFAKNDITNFLSGGSDFSHRDARFTGRAGVTWVSTSGIAPYFAYSTSFLPNAGIFIYNNTTKQSTDPAKPSDSRQIEGGLKFQPRTWTSFMTASIFQINQTNVIVADAAFNNIRNGEVRSRGVELESVAAFGRGLNLHGSYTLTATNTIKTLPGATPETDASLDKWLPQTPRNQFSAIADYTQAEGRFAGLGGNFGVRFVGTNAADSTNSFFVPNYTLLDAGLRFGYRHTLFRVNATNLTDKRYVATCSGLSFCYYGYARNVVGSATYRF